MAYKIDTNALALAKKVETKITIEQLMNVSQAAIGNTYEGNDQSGQSFADYVKSNWLSGQLMDVSSPQGKRDSWLHYLKRGWHHNTTVRIHRNKRARKGTVEMVISMYDPRTMQIALNYILRNLRRTAQGKGLTKAWSSYKGARRVKEELGWMYDKMFSKIFQEESRVK